MAPTIERPATCAVLARPLGRRVAKRLFDVAFSAVVVVLAVVPCLVLCVMVALDTGGSPIYTQVRAGRGGRPFRILKFRTMVADSDDVDKYLTPEQRQTWEREHKLDDDPRITRLGALLRATSIDELPQFLNVLAGQMSVVGPRAVTFEELSWFGADTSLLLSVRPGITGAWQVGPRNAATFESGERTAIELAYVREATLAGDCRIVLKTFSAVTGRTGR